MFRQPFSFEGRIRRTEFGISFIIYMVITISIELFAAYLGEGAHGGARVVRGREYAGTVRGFSEAGNSEVGEDRQGCGRQTAIRPRTGNLKPHLRGMGQVPTWPNCNGSTRNRA